MQMISNPSLAEPAPVAVKLPKRPKDTLIDSLSDWIIGFPFA
jgi:hypothetical protein